MCARADCVRCWSVGDIPAVTGMAAHDAELHLAVCRRFSETVVAADAHAIAAFIVGDGQPVADVRLRDVTMGAVRTAFASYAETHAAASILRWWSTWNVLCGYLFGSELIPAESRAANRTTQDRQDTAQEFGPRGRFRRCCAPCKTRRPRVHGALTGSSETAPSS